MGDPPPLAGPAADHLVARPHDVFARRGSRSAVATPDSGSSSATSSGAAGKRPDRRGQRVTASSPIGLMPIAPAGIGVGWLFCTHRMTRSPGAGAGRPA